MLMFRKGYRISDACFLIQVACTLVFGFYEVKKMLSEAEGISITWFALTEAFVLLNAILTWNAYRAKPDRVSKQAMVSYLTWIVVLTGGLLLMVITNTGTWYLSDTIVTVVACVGVAVTVFFAYAKSIGVADAWVKCWLAIWCKTAPQCIIALAIFAGNGSGFTVAAIFAGHVTIGTRIVQLICSLMEAQHLQYDSQAQKEVKFRNIAAALVSELTNEASWTLITFAYFFT